MDYRTALVTGASSGLGRGLSLALGSRGVHVVCAARRRAQLESLVDEITRAGGSAELLELDCAEDEQAYRTLRAFDENKPIDLVIANAGWGAPTPAQSFDWVKVKKILQINVMGAAATISAVLPGMVARGQGHVVGMASLAGFRGLPAWAAYSGSKAAMIAFCESLRVDLQKTGVAVTTLCPGYVKTELTSKNPGPMPFLLELDQAVKIMMRAIERRQAVCAFPKPMAAAARSAPLVPRPLYHWVTRRSKVQI